VAQACWLAGGERCCVASSARWRWATTSPASDAFADEPAAHLGVGLGTIGLLVGLIGGVFALAVTAARRADIDRSGGARTFVALAALAAPAALLDRREPLAA
jgi:hypothetical protein